MDYNDLVQCHMSVLAHLCRYAHYGHASCAHQSNPNIHTYPASKLYPLANLWSSFHSIAEAVVDQSRTNGI